MPGGAHDNMKLWEPEEDEIILQMHDTIGPKWKIITQHLPGRTISSVRNRFQRIEKGREVRKSGAKMNVCHMCGQPKRGHVCRAKSRMGVLATLIEGGNAAQTDSMIRNIQSMNLPPPAKLSPMMSRGYSIDGHTKDENMKTNMELLGEDLFSGQENEQEARQQLFECAPSTYLRPLSTYFQEIADIDEECEEWFGGDNAPPILVTPC